MMMHKQKPIVENPDDVQITQEEVAKHRKDNDCWMVWNGRVYDVTNYIKSHPGGRKIMAAAGKDCTALVNKYHHWVNVHFIVGKLQIGVLKR